jgi:hypothetical protein
MRDPFFEMCLGLVSIRPLRVEQRPAYRVG